MTTDMHQITVSGIKVEVLRKDIKNLHLGVYPPNGRVRVAAPLVLNDDAVRLAVIDKLSWIRRQKAKFAEQPRQSEREIVSGESHYFLGKRYRLRVHECDAPARLTIRGIASLDLYVRPGTSAAQREAILQRWYREQLKALILPLLVKWQPIIGVQVVELGVRKMRTKWGSCNPNSRRIWLNLELAKVPEKCIEYIVVHELVHLIERRHNASFVALLKEYLPEWEVTKRRLTCQPLRNQS